MSSNRRKQKLTSREAVEAEPIDIAMDLTLDICSQSSVSSSSGGYSQEDLSSQELEGQSSSQSSNGSASSSRRKSMSGKKLGRPLGRSSSYQRKMEFKASNQEDVYERQRLKNNEAVRKSREKARQHLTQTLDQIKNLEESNEKLEKDIDVFTKELTLIRLLYKTHVKTAHGWILGEGDFICKQDEEGKKAIEDKKYKDKKVVKQSKKHS